MSEEIDKPTPPVGSTDTIQTNSTTVIPNKNATKKKKKKNNSNTPQPDGKRQDVPTPTPASAPTDTSSTLDKLQALSINNTPSDKMSVVRCGAVRILATIADIKVNGACFALDALAADPHAWQVMASWFMRYPYSSIC